MRAEPFHFPWYTCIQFFYGSFNYNTDIVTVPNERKNSHSFLLLRFRWIIKMYPCSVHNIITRTLSQNIPIHKSLRYLYVIRLCTKMHKMWNWKSFYNTRRNYLKTFAIYMRVCVCVKLLLGEYANVQCWAILFNGWVGPIANCGVMIFVSLQPIYLVSHWNLPFLLIADWECNA